MRLNLIIGLGMAFIIIFISLIYFIAKINKNITSEKKLQKSIKYKCAVGQCEIIINTKKTKSKFCQFHEKVQKLHIELTEKNDPLKNRSLMYMSTNGQLFNTVHQQEEIYKSLQSKN